MIQKIMTRLLAAAAAPAPLWNSFEAAVRQTFRSMTAPAAEASVFKALDSEQARMFAEEDGMRLRQRIAAAYPFHPALIDVMRERWCSTRSWMISMVP